MKQTDFSNLEGRSLADYQAPETGALRLGDEIKPLLADFTHEGVDLRLTSEDGGYITIHDYFSSGPGVDLITAGGARIPSDLVSKLAGPGPIAQAAGTQSDAGGPIGEIVRLEGSVTVRHADGTSGQLAEGAPVYQGDIVETGAGSSFTIVFVDNTQFSMNENGRAVLDELVYNPSAGSGKFGISLLQGIFSLVSGQIAKDEPENVDVRTPVGTIGIRGTSWSGEIRSIGEESVFTLFSGAIAVTNEAGSQLLTLPNQTVIVRSYSTPPSQPFVLSEQQVIELYGEVLRLINPDWFKDEDDLDPDKINPEGGRRAYNSGGGAGFNPFVDGQIDGGLGIGDLLKSADLLDETELDLDREHDIQEITGLGPQTSISVVSITDPATGATQSFQIVISLSEPTNVPVTITYELRAGTASGTDTGLPGGLDFTVEGGNDGQIVIPPGATRATFTVTVVDDDVIENVEFFVIALTGAQNADINVAASQALVVITDDDIGVVTLSNVTVGGLPVAEGEVVSVDESAGVLTFELTLDKAVAPGVTVAVNYVITGTATAGSDYLTDAVQTVLFEGGESGLAPGATAVINIPIIDDSIAEAAETLTIRLVGGSSNVVVGSGSETLTVVIEDNDYIPIEIGEATPVDVAESADDAVVEEGSIGIVGEIASVIFDTVQADFAALGLTSQGSPIVLQGLGTNSVTAMGNGVPVFTVTLNLDGSYDFTLLGPIDHLDGTGANIDEVVFSLAFTATGPTGVTASGALPVQITDSGPVVGAVAPAEISEAALPDGTDPSPADAVVIGFVPVDFGLDGAGSVSLDISSLPTLTAGGDPVVYSVTLLPDGVTQRIAAMAVPESGAARPVFSLDFGPDGAGGDYRYVLTLKEPLDHPTGGDSLDLTFAFEVTDRDGTVTRGDFTASILDDAPIASPDLVEVPALALPDYNLLFVLDVSGSMGQNAPGTGETRIGLLRAAVDNMLQEYAGAARAMNITIIAFSAAAAVVYSGSSIDEARAFVVNEGNLVPGGTTSYAAALANTPNGAMGVLSQQLANPALDGYTTAVYFVSDGAPSAGQAVPTAGGNAWQQFVDANDIEVVAIGLGNDVSDVELAKVENAGDVPTIVTDPADLQAVMADMVPVMEADNVVSSGSIDSPGADGARLTGVIYNGEMFDVPADGTPLVIETLLNGQLSIDADGNYVYSAPPGTPAGAMDQFEYILTDGDGDISITTLTFSFVETGVGSVAAFAAFAAQPSFITGTDQGDILVGTAGDDVIAGLDGDDMIYGNGGNDVLSGGAGADVFYFTTVSGGQTVITDFDASEDSINLDQLFDTLGLLADERGQGESWELAAVDGNVVLSFRGLEAGPVVIENYAVPDLRALDDLAAKIVVDES